MLQMLCMRRCANHNRNRKMSVVEQTKAGTIVSGMPMPEFSRIMVETITGECGAEIFTSVLSDTNFDKIEKLEKFAAERG